MSRISITAMLLAAPLACVAQAAGAETLVDALATARAESPMLRSQRAQVDALGEVEGQARASYGPQVSLGANSTAYRDEQNNNSAVALSVSQPIFYSGRIRNEVGARKADTRAGEQRLRAAEADLLSRVARAYADVRRDEAGLGQADELLRLLAGQAEEVSTRRALSQVTLTDVDQVGMRQAEARAARAAALGQLESSRAEYANLVGRRPGTLAPLPAVRGFANLDAAIAAAEDTSPAIAAARFDQQGTKARVAAARSEYGPTVAVRGNVGYQQVWQFGRQEAIRADSVGVVFSQPLFTSGLNRSRVREALDRDRAAESLVDNARRQVTRDIEQAWSAATAAHARVAAGQERVQRAQGAREGVQIEFRGGFRTTLDVLNASRELNLAEMELVSAERDAFVADVALLETAGVLEQGSFSEAPPAPPPPRIAPGAALGPMPTVVAPRAVLATAPPADAPMATAAPVAAPVPAAVAAPVASVVAPSAAAAGADTSAKAPLREPIALAPTPSPAASLRFAVQTGAYDSADAAQAGLGRLADRTSVAGKAQRVQTATVKGKVYYRALFVGFDDKAAAAGACKALGAACFVREAPSED